MDKTENIQAITDFLFIENDDTTLTVSDLVVILCNQNIKGIANKFDYLFKQRIINDNSKIVLSGNHGALDEFDGKECENVKRILVGEYGYSEDCFILEDQATNIYENLLYTRELVGDLSKYKSILFIGASFALRRIKLCATKLKYPVNKIQFVGTVDSERNISKDSWWKEEKSRIRVYQELERIGRYLAKGDLDIK